MVSVTINQSERGQIIHKVEEQFHKLIMASRPNPEFYKELAQKVYLDSVETIREFIGTPVQKYLPHIKVREFPSLLAGSRISSDIDTTIVEVNNNVHVRGNNILNNTKHFSISTDDVTFPPPAEVITDNKMLWVAHEYPDATGSSYEAKEFTITAERVAEIEAFNLEMHEALDPLIKQRETIVNLINVCKTTNQFEKSLPESLRALYPKSVLKKMEDKKNEDNNTQVDEETLAKRKLMDDAASSLAAATLI